MTDLLELSTPPVAPLFGPPEYRDRRAATWESDTEYWFDPPAAERVIDFVETFIVHVKGHLAGQTIKLEPWQKWFISEVYGWKRRDAELPENCTRQYRECWLELPRKNSKTTMGSALCLYHLMADGEQGGEVYGFASTLEQAGIAFQIAKGMVEGDEELAKRLTIYGGSSGNFKSIVHDDSNSFYRVVPSKPESLHGGNMSFGLGDEIHAWPVGKDQDLYDVARTSQGSRRQPLFLQITTAGFDRESLWWKQRNHAQSVSDGTITDPTFLPVVFAAADDDPWDEPETWKKANPNYGVSIFPEFLASECERAKAAPAKQNSFLRLYLNRKTSQRTRWLALSDWDACQNIKMPNLNGRSCYAGLDLASTTDITALVQLFPPVVDKEPWWIVPTFWVPEDTMRERTRADKVPYEEWAKRGLLRVTDGNSCDYDFIRADLKHMAARCVFTELAIDRWNSSQLVNQLQEDGMNVTGFGQGYASMSAPTKRLEVMILGRELAHDGHEVLRWMISNTATVEDPAGNIKPAKDKSSEKIDGVVSLIMALGRALDDPSSAYAAGGGLFAVGG